MNVFIALKGSHFLFLFVSVFIAKSSLLQIERFDLSKALLARLMPNNRKRRLAAALAKTECLKGNATLKHIVFQSKELYKP